MAATALKHRNNNYRAYKKIDGQEHQFYSPDKKEADKMQKKYNKMADQKLTLPFSKCGRLKGVRLSIYSKEGKTSYIIFRVQIGPQGNQQRAQVKYVDPFNKSWLSIRRVWAEYHDIHKVDLASYTKELKAAKKLYIEDLQGLQKELA